MQWVPIRPTSKSASVTFAALVIFLTLEATSGVDPEPPLDSVRFRSVYFFRFRSAEAIALAAVYPAATGPP